MPVRTRAKAAARGRPQRLPTQFGELDTTPTSRHHAEADSPPATPVGGSLLASPDLDGQATQPLAGKDIFNDDLEDVDLVTLGDTQPAIHEIRRRTSIQWSETESLARRSSPLCPDEAPLADWQFDEDDSLPPLSTPRSGRDQLPDTVPLVDTQSAPEEGGASAVASKKIDFSETASTMRRSSPVGSESMNQDFGCFDHLPSDLDSPLPSEGNLDAGPTQTSPRHGPAHLPMDNIYDVTPPPAKTQQAAESKPTANAARRRGAYQPARERLALQSDKSNAEESTGAQSRPANAKRSLNKVPEPVNKASELHQASPANTGRAKPTVSAEGSNLIFEADQPEADAAQTDKGKKRKQRPKPPLQFDETNRVKEAQSRPSARAPQKLRMPVVSALRESIQPSSSPNVVTRKRGAANNKQPRTKKAKATCATQKQKPMGAAKRPAPVKQRAECTTQQNEASSSAEPAVTTPDPIIISSDGDDGFAIPPSSDQALGNDDEEPVFLPEATFLSPPGAGVSNPLASVSSSQYLARAIVDADFLDATQAVDAGSRQHGEEVASRKLLDTRDRSDGVGRPAGAQKRTLSDTSPPSIEAMPPERKISRQDRQQGRPSRRASRNYSVSIHGSPLPANHTTSDHGPAIIAGTANSIKDCPPPKFLNRSQLKAAAEEVSSRRADWLQRVRVAEDEARRPTEPRDTATAPPLQGIPGDVRAQILASLREHDEENLRRCGGADGPGQDCGDKDDAQVDERDRLPDNLSQQLHEVVNTMLRHLRSKEEAGHKVAETYRRNTSGCVEKIRNRQKQERRALMEGMRLDGDKFGQVVRKARNVVNRERQSRAAGIRELEQNTAERQATYDRAMASLRTLHRQLLQGNEDSGKQG
ncbi:hypothetical protein XA68_10030 [Ophiocordyceps unilateralis]|uniref:Uncharacterized protein n=1 Tax=Ophiocordyceps unilateralis TaxID=268505 RepID=A0A2A9PQP2_OPHUN|nr:hypothetical protein XA68_10030 [Ophiocordyceps unilateralis]